MQSTSVMALVGPTTCVDVALQPSVHFVHSGRLMWLLIRYGGWAVTCISSARIDNWKTWSKDLKVQRRVTQLLIKISICTEPEKLLPCSQQPVPGSHLQPAELYPHCYILAITFRLNIVLSPRVPSRPPPWTFLYLFRISYAPIIFCCTSLLELLSHINSVWVHTRTTYILNTQLYGNARICNLLVHALHRVIDNTNNTLILHFQVVAG
jgi:hypothetical protein